MTNKIKVSNPSRLCLFGEHQDYLGLEVVAVAINLRFSAEVSPREDSLIRIKIRDEKLDALNVENTEGLYQEYITDISKEIVYDSDEDFMRSTINVLKKRGYPLRGFDIKMDSEIPIGKGMCSSSTMVVAIIKALLEGIGHPDAKDPYKIAHLAFEAEVAEFGHPGGMMDQFASALGGLVNLKFENGTEAFPIERELGGVFILFDSLERKDTIRVLAASKIPTLEGLDMLKEYGVRGIEHLAFGGADVSLVDKLDDFRRKKVLTNIDNYKILKKGIELLKSEGEIDEELGRLIYAHHVNLRDGLGISTPTIEKILDTAIANGAYGGKINGSGGGGCCYVYAPREEAEKIIEEVEKLGYPGKILTQDTGVRVD
ncbi:MAG: hypothetical protein IKM21_01730 [Oscillospiraceae bacterium]|nr:hypothetical protein [Oscillospiraceae bacterium]